MTLFRHGFWGLLVSTNRVDDTYCNENNVLREPSEWTLSIKVEDKLGVLSIWRGEPL